MEYIPNESERTEAMEIILKAAAESITMERLKKISSYREETKKRNIIFVKVPLKYSLYAKIITALRNNKR